MVSYKEEYLRSIGIFKDAVLAILATIAKQERIRLSESVHAGLRRARAKGRTAKSGGAARASLPAGGAWSQYSRIAAEVGVSSMTIQRILSSPQSGQLGGVHPFSDFTSDIPDRLRQT